MYRFTAVILLGAGLVLAPAAGAQNLSSWDQTQLKKTAKDLDRYEAKLAAAHRDDFRTDSGIADWRRTGDLAGQYLKRAMDKNHAKIKEMEARVEAYKAAIEAKIVTAKGEAAAVDSKYGDVTARYKEIYARCYGPSALRGEFEAAAFEVWVTRIKEMKEKCAADGAYLSAAREDDHPAMKVSNHQIMERYLRVDFAKKLKEAIDNTGERFDRVLRSRAERIEWVKQLDPKKVGDAASSLQRESVAQETAQLQKYAAEARLGEKFDQALRDKGPDSRKELVSGFEEAIAMLEKKRVEALELARMPKDLRKGTLAGIAKRTLKKKDYGVGKVLRMVVNSGKEKVERSEWQDGTKVNWRSDQFQVCTAEPDGDGFYLFYNTLAYFYTGSSVTPLKKWVVTNRHRSIEILQKNINKK